MTPEQTVLLAVLAHSVTLLIQLLNIRGNFRGKKMELTYSFKEKAHQDFMDRATAFAKAPKSEKLFLDFLFACYSAKHDAPKRVQKALIESVIIRAQELHRSKTQAQLQMLLDAVSCASEAMGDDTRG